MQPATINRHVAHAAWKDLPMMGDRLPHTGRSGDLDCPCGFKGEHHVLVVAAKGDRLGDVVAVENVEDRARAKPVFFGKAKKPGVLVGEAGEVAPNTTVFLAAIRSWRVLIPWPAPFQTPQDWMSECIEPIHSKSLVTNFAFLLP